MLVLSRLERIADGAWVREVGGTTLARGGVGVRLVEYCGRRDGAQSRWEVITDGEGIVVYDNCQDALAGFDRECCLSLL